MPPKKPRVDEFGDRLVGGTPLWKMSNLHTDATRLPFIIWVIPGGRQNQPQVKVQRDYSPRSHGDTFSMSIDSDPRIVAGDPGALESQDVRQAAKFIQVNRDLLLQYWADEITTKYLLDHLRPME